MQNPRQSLLGQAWLVLVLSLLFGGTLAGVHLGLEGRIDANRRAETLGRIPMLVLGSDTATGAEVTIEGDRLVVQLIDGAELSLVVEESDRAGHQVFEVLAGDQRQRLGWVVRGAGQGYGDRIDLLIGLRGDGSEITGLFVLDQKETPALGDAIAKRPFQVRFEGAPADRPIELARNPADATDPSKILALTAATISSQSVCDIVNRTLAEIRPEIVQEEWR